MLKAICTVFKSSLIYILNYLSSNSLWLALARMLNTIKSPPKAHAIPETTNTRPSLPVWSTTQPVEREIVDI